MTKTANYRHLANKRWYIQTFNATPVLINLGGCSGVHLMPKTLGYGYYAFIKDFKKGLCEMYYDRDSLHYIAHQFEDRLHKDPKYMDKLYKLSIKHRNELLKYIKDNLPNLKLFKDKELVESYKMLSKLYCQLLAAWHMLEGYTLTRDTKLKRLLLRDLEKRGLRKSFNEFFSKLTEPVKIPFVTDYNNALVKLLKVILGREKLFVKLRNLSAEEFQAELDNFPMIQHFFAGLEKDFFWVKANYKEAPRLKTIDFINELKRLIDEKRKPEVVDEKEFENNQTRKQELIKKLKLSDDLVEVITVTDFMGWWQDDRKKNTLIGCCAMDDFMAEIGHRFNIKLEHMRYWLPNEITLPKLRKAAAKFLQDRVNGCFVIYEQDNFDVLTARDYLDMRASVKKHEDGEEVKELMGMCASTGKAIGKVHICKTINDIKSFKKGDVLVTGMTRPEFVSAMSKSVAVVTDEGGITCHAAVISRELGIPCVIGTKIATKSLKNGDLVEVNANHGMVKILR